jgi:glycosyltransferase involved in cell wall biosynthesis
VKAAFSELTVLYDLKEENWASMDVVAEMLVSELERRHAEEVRSARFGPELHRRFSRLPSFGRTKTALNADILVNRLWDYPRSLRGLCETGGLFHVCDHSYANLVHSLPAERTGVFCHDLDAFHCVLEPSRDPRPWWFRRVTRHVLDGMSKAALVFHSTEDVRRRIEKQGLIDGARLVHAPYGISPVFVPEPGAEDARVPELTGFGDAPYLLHVGVCTPRKRIDVLLDVFAEVRRQRPELKLVQVGGKFTPAHLARIQRAGVGKHVVQVPRVPHERLPALHRRAALVLQPSESEGFGLPVVEALACGAVVVASDIPVLREVGGRAAVYCPVGDVAEWSRTVVRLVAEPPSARDRTARLEHTARFSWANHARTILGAYRRLQSE